MAYRSDLIRPIRLTLIQRPQEISGESAMVPAYVTCLIGIADEAEKHGLPSDVALDRFPICADQAVPVADQCGTPWQALGYAPLFGEVRSPEDADGGDADNGK
jgi:hypothetical protein